MLRSILNAGTSSLQNAALLAANVVVAVLVIGLIAVTLMVKFEDTPEIKNLACFIGIERTDCPDYKAKLREAEERERKLTGDIASLEQERQRLQEEKVAIEEDRVGIERQLASLQSLLASFDSLMGFEHFDSPDGQHSFSVGTIYKTFVDLDDAVEDWQCYFNLPAGNAGEDRNLYVRSTSGDIDIKNSQLGHAGISRETLTWARERCRPRSIEGDT